MGSMGSLLEELIAWMADALEDGFRTPKFRRGRTTISTHVAQSMQSTMQSSRQGLSDVKEQPSTSQTSPASSAPTSSNTQRSKGLSLSSSRTILYRVKYRDAAVGGDVKLGEERCYSVQTYPHNPRLKDDPDEARRVAENLREVYSHVWIERVETIVEEIDG